MISRRKALSLLGLGAALGFTLSSTLEPLEAEDKRPPRPPPRPLRRPERTDATAARAAKRSPSATAHAPHWSTCPRRSASTAVAVRLLLNAMIARFDESSELHMPSADYAKSEAADKKKRRKESMTFPQNSREKIL